MRYLSAQYILTNTGEPLKKAVVAVKSDGTIDSVIPNDGNLAEGHSIEFYNGIIVPGLVNCHCHLELSHMKGKTDKGAGLGSFIFNIRNNRESSSASIEDLAAKADADMFRDGVSLCADICNTALTFSIKKKSRITYLNLLEIFGIDKTRAERRTEDLKNLCSEATREGIDFQMTPHSAYSMSLTLMKWLSGETKANRVTSIHFMENCGEKTLLEEHSGPLMDSYRNSGLLPAELELPANHIDAIQNYVTRSGNLILVHNTCSDASTVRAVNKRGNTYWCLCPGSNIYIENSLPPLAMLQDEGCEIVIGTDSLASNTSLSVFEEMKLLQAHFPGLSITELVQWATINGARALGSTDKFGTIEAGKKPGLILISNADLQNMKLLPSSIVKRLV